MTSDKPAPPTTDLNGCLEQRIQRRTGGRIRCLRVEASRGRVAVHGYTPSYSVLQLAIAAVQETLEESESGQFQQVEWDIKVGSAGSATL